MPERIALLKNEWTGKVRTWGAQLNGIASIPYSELECVIIGLYARWSLKAMFYCLWECSKHDQKCFNFAYLCLDEDHSEWQLDCIAMELQRGDSTKCSNYVMWLCAPSPTLKFQHLCWYISTRLQGAVQRAALIYVEDCWLSWDISSTVQIAYHMRGDLSLGSLKIIYWYTALRCSLVPLTNESPSKYIQLKAEGWFCKLTCRSTIS